MEVLKIVSQKMSSNTAWLINNNLPPLMGRSLAERNLVNLDNVLAGFVFINEIMAQQNVEKSFAETQHLFVLPIFKVSLKQMTETQLRSFLPNMLMYSTGNAELDWTNESKQPPWWPRDVQWANILTNERLDSLERTDALRNIVVDCYKYHGREDLLSTIEEEEKDKNAKNNDENPKENPLNILDRSIEFSMICRLCLNNVSSAGVDIFSFRDNEEIASILNLHFWFQISKGDGHSDRLCTNCWTAIEGFHKFFKCLQQIHHISPESLVKVELGDDFGNTYSDMEIKVEEQIEDMNISNKINMVDNKFSEFMPNVELFLETADVFEGKHIQPTHTHSKIKRKSIKAVRGKHNSERFSDGGHLINAVHEITNYVPLQSDEQITTANDENSLDEDEYIRQIFNMNCRNCSHKFENFDEAKLHYRTVHNVKSTYLSCCRKRFYVREKAIQHAIEVHLNSVPTDSNDECKICDKKFKNKYCLRYHNDVHHSENTKKFICSVCGEKFYISRALKQHYALLHEKKLFNCEYCDKEFPLENRLLLHIKNIHEPSFTSICDICGQLFKSKSLLVKHYRLVHTTDAKRLDKVQCGKCGKWISNKIELKRHLNRHDISENGTTKNCSICNKQFLNQLKWKDHMHRVHREKLHKCKECNKSFRNRTCLLEHTALHTGEDLYKCAYCERTFKSNSNMYNHRKTIHFKEWTRDREQNIIQEFKITKSSTISMSNET